MFCACALSVSAALGGGGLVWGAGNTSAFDSGRPVSRDFLMVADPAAKKLFFYSVPGLAVTGELDGIDLGDAPAHGGTIALPDGRILMNDAAAGKTLAVRLDRQGRPTVVTSVRSVLGTEAPWTTVDPSFRYYAVVSNNAGHPSRATVNVINLRTFRNTPIELPLNHSSEDLHPYLHGRPLRLDVAIGGANIVSYSLAKIVDGRPFTELGRIDIGSGTHSHFISPGTHTLGIDTTAGVDVIKTSPAGALGGRVTVPWAADGLSGGRGFRTRLAFDGAHVLNSIGIYPADPNAWAEARQELHVTDLVRKTARRIFVGNGTTQRGFADAPTSARFMPYVLIHSKDDPRGDELKIIDVAATSPSYLQIVGTASLGHMTDGPVAGADRNGKELRFTAITPGGRYAFATQGGDGKVEMVNTSDMSVTPFDVPSALHGGGYLTAFHLGSRPVDLMGR